MGGIAVTGLAIALAANQGHAQVKFAQDAVPGPGSGAATLRMPWEASPQTTPGAANVATPAFLNPTGGFKPIPPYQEAPDPNKDILVTAAQGPWLICVNWYEGAEAPQMARKMAMDLRENYKLPAYVFNRGADERRKEYERVKKLIEQQRAFLIEKNLPLNAPLRIKTRHIEEQCAILVGNYPDADAARAALNQIRTLKPPDPSRVSLATIFKGETDSTGKITKGEHAYVNPFTTAFVVHNPLLKVDRPEEWQQQDMAFLKKLNQNEEFSLLKCSKPYTILVKEFLLPAVLQSSVKSTSAGSNFLAKIGLGNKTNNSENAALNAHNMAVLFRSKVDLTAYVLHTRYSSIVTVGGFDGPDDPSLRATQEMLTTRLKIPQAAPIQVPR